MGKIISKILIAALLLSACSERELGPQSTNGDLVRPDSAAVVIVNEGNFQWGNASVGQYDPISLQYQEGLFATANDRPIGDVLQSVHHIDGWFYALLNGSNLLRICRADWQEISHVQLLGAPRRLCEVGQSLWISDWYNSDLLQLSLNGTLIKQIDLGKAPEHLLNWHEELLIAEKRIIKRLDPLSLRIDTILSLPANLSAWVLSDGALIYALSNGALYRLAQPGTRATLIEEAPSGSQGLSSDGQGNFFSFRADSIFLHSPGKSYRSQFWQSAPCQNFYNLVCRKQALYLFDAMDFVQASRIRHYQLQNASLVSDFEAGAISNGLGQ